MYLCLVGQFTKSEVGKVVEKYINMGGTCGLGDIDSCDVCNGNNCDHTTGNAYYDFCGKCVGGNTQDNGGDVLLSGQYHRGCGCDSTDPRAGDLDLLEYYYDGDADGFGCELDIDGNNFATITISQLDVYNAIQLRYNNLSDGVVTSGNSGPFESNQSLSSNVKFLLPAFGPMSASGNKSAPIVVPAASSPSVEALPKLINSFLIIRYF